MDWVTFTKISVIGIIIGLIIGITFFGAYLSANTPKMTVTIRGLYKTPPGWFIENVNVGMVCHVVGILKGDVEPEALYNGMGRYLFIQYGNKTIVCDDQLDPTTFDGTRVGLFYSDHAVVTLRKEFPIAKFFWGTFAFILCGLMFTVVLFLTASALCGECKDDKCK